MATGKAKAHDPESGDHGHTFIAPCLSRIDEAAIKGHLEREEFFWLDLASPSAEDIQALGRLFGFHPLALEDVAEFGQRPKLDDYEHYVFLVFYGCWHERSGEQSLLHEVHLFVSGQYLVTIHHDELSVLQRQQAQLDGRALHSEQFLIYRVLDALTDTYFPILSEIDDDLDDVETALLADPTEECLQRLFELKRELVGLRKVVSPQRDLFARAIDQIAELPGLSLDERDYFRDIYDHLIRISEMIDSYRDLASGATDLYLSTVSNRQNDVMKQLTIIATVFLPLSFLTGFFGMNFSLLTGHVINTTWSFWVLGIGSMVATFLGLGWFFHRRGWL
jgi:magnesium transporter